MLHGRISHRAVPGRRGRGEGSPTPAQTRHHRRIRRRGPLRTLAHRIAVRLCRRRPSVRLDRLADPRRGNELARGKRESGRYCEGRSGHGLTSCSRNYPTVILVSPRRTVAWHCKRPKWGKCVSVSTTERSRRRRCLEILRLTGSGIEPWVPVFKAEGEVRLHSSEMNFHTLLTPDGHVVSRRPAERLSRFPACLGWLDESLAAVATSTWHGQEDRLRVWRTDTGQLVRRGGAVSGRQARGTGPRACSGPPMPGSFLRPPQPAPTSMPWASGTQRADVCGELCKPAFAGRLAGFSCFPMAVTSRSAATTPALRAPSLFGFGISPRL